MDNNNMQAPQQLQQSQPQQPGYPQQQPPYPPQGQPPYGPAPYGQPYPPRPPKQPMDPKKKETIITWSCVGAGLVIVGVALAIILPAVFRVDYSTAYRAAGELKSKVYDIYSNYDCENVIDYVDSSYISNKDYEKYITDCKETVSGTDGLVNTLANTDGIKKNQELSSQFETVKKLIEEIVPKDEELAEKLNMYKIWHEWGVMLDEMEWTDVDSKIQAAANILINSGVDAFKTYGEGWLEKTLETAHAYQAYDNESYLSNNKSTLREEYENKKSERSDWIAANKPDIETMAPLEFSNTSAMYTEYNKFYQNLADIYELNYNAESDDCTEFIGEIICD